MNPLARYLRGAGLGDGARIRVAQGLTIVIGAPVLHRHITEIGLRVEPRRLARSTGAGRGTSARSWPARSRALAGRHPGQLPGDLDGDLLRRLDPRPVAEIGRGDRPALGIDPGLVLHPGRRAVDLNILAIIGCYGNT